MEYSNPSFSQKTRAASRSERVSQQPAEPAAELPSQGVLDRELVRILLEPPDGVFAQELIRDIGKRMKRGVSALMVAEGLAHLSRQQRGSGAKERSFVRSA